MKQLLPLLFLLTGCNTITRPFSPTPSTTPATTSTPAPQPPILDPLVDAEIGAQSHIYPFFFIASVVLLLCFVPYFYMKMKPCIQNFCSCKVAPYIKEKFSKRIRKEESEDDKKT